jgi:hypothetical protein
MRRAMAGSVSSEDLLAVGVDVTLERDVFDRQGALVARATHYDVIPFVEVDSTRAYASSGADLGLRVDGGDTRWAMLSAGIRRLRYKPDEDFDWIGPAAAFTVGAELWHGANDADVDVRAGYRLEHRGYRGGSFINGCGPGEMPGVGCFVTSDEPRTDLHHVVTVDVLYTGDQVLEASYKWVGNDSSSFGRSLDRHRLSLSATISAPARLFVTAAVTGQVDRYADPLMIPRDVALEFESFDEENRSAMSVRVARVLSPRWQIEARAAFYANLFVPDDREFRRLLIYGGLTWEGASEPD